MKNISPALRQTPSRLWLDACRIGTGFFLIIAFWLAPCSPSHADCSLSAQTFTFGSINPQFNGALYTSGTATISCTNLTRNTTVSACLAIGAGNASGSTSSARKISAAGPGNQIPVVIKSSPSSSQEIGTDSFYPKAGPITFQTNASGNGSVTFPITIQMSGPLAVAPGTYSNTFSGSSFQASFRVGSFANSCKPVNTLVSGGQMIIQAVIVPSCTVTASALNFGIASLLTAARQATSTITLNCTQGVTASIGLDNGQTGTAPASRQMRSGSSAITYGIYQNASHTLPWGQTTGIDTVSILMGQATSTSVTAFGEVPVQTTPSPGSYTDVVNVIVTY